MPLAEILGPVLRVDVEDDGALRVHHEGMVASLRTVTIADGLEMISLTQMLAWDLPLTAKLRKTVAAQAHNTLLGTVTLVEHADGDDQGRRGDVVLRYNFPSGGLADPALQTLILMVLAGGADVRRALG
jgi:hypothetical protein